MTRAFEPTPINAAIVDRLLDDARRAPSAGNSASLEFLVLTDSQTDDYWDVTLPAERRATFAWPDLLAAPILIIPWVDPAAYVNRYAEPDKTHTGLGSSTEAWPVPYWFVDGGATVMSLLLGAEAAGLGALLFGLFDHEDAVRARFGVPSLRRAVGTVAIGHPATRQRRSLSARRPRRPLHDVVHHGHWSGLV